MSAAAELDGPPAVLVMDSGANPYAIDCVSMACDGLRECRREDEAEAAARARRRCARCVLSTIADLTLVAAQMAVVVSSAAGVCTFGPSRQTGCAAFAAVAAFLTLTLRFSAWFAETLAAFCRRAQLGALTVSCVLLVLLWWLEVSVDVNLRRCMRLFAVLSLVTASVTAASVYAHYSLCAGTGGEVVWRLTVLFSAVGAAVGGALPFTATSPVWTVAPLAASAANCLRDSGAGLTRTCLWRRARVAARLDPSRRAGACVGRVVRPDGAPVNEDQVSCVGVVRRAALRLTLTLGVVAVIPCVLVMQRYSAVGGWRQEGESLAIALVEMAVAVILGLLVALAMPTRGEGGSAPAVVCCMGVSVGLLGAIFAACGMSLGPVLYVTGATLVAAHTADALRRANRGVRGLAAAVVARALFGFLMISMAACASVAWSVDLSRGPADAGGGE